MIRSTIGIIQKYSIPSTLWNNLIAYFTGDNTPNDALGTYNGTLVNGATYTTGKINNGFSFDGVNDYVITTTNSSLDTTTAHSYSLWIKPTTVNTYMFYVSTCTGSSGFSIGNDNAGNLAMFKGSVNIENLSGYYLTANTMYHIVVVYKGASFGANNLLFYVNGSLVSTKTASMVYDTAKPFVIGADGNTTARYYKGLIDEVAIWNRIITATEVTQLYNSGEGKQYPN